MYPGCAILDGAVANGNENDIWWVMWKNRMWHFFLLRMKQRFLNNKNKCGGHHHPCNAANDLNCSDKQFCFPTLDMFSFFFFFISELNRLTARTGCTQTTPIRLNTRFYPLVKKKSLFNAGFAITQGSKAEQKTIPPLCLEQAMWKGKS